MGEPAPDAGLLAIAERGRDAVDVEDNGARVVVEVHGEDIARLDVGGHHGAQDRVAFIMPLAPVRGVGLSVGGKITRAVLVIRGR